MSMLELALYVAAAVTGWVGGRYAADYVYWHWIKR